MLDICIVTYNRLPYLKKCVWSIVAGTELPYRIFVIDDNSDDGTKEWLVEQRSRKIIHAISLNKEGHGTAWNFNNIIDATDSDWVVMLNDDMWFHRGWDKRGLEIIKGQSDCGIVSFYNYQRIGIDPLHKISESLIRVHRTGLGAIFLHRKLYENVGKFYLSKGRRMGFFATPFCNKVAKSKLKRNKIYCPVPAFATHMDYEHCRLNEIDSLEKYAKHRVKHKHGGKFKKDVFKKKKK